MTRRHPPGEFIDLDITATPEYLAVLNQLVNRSGLLVSRTPPRTGPNYPDDPRMRVRIRLRTSR